MDSITLDEEDLINIISMKKIELQKEGVEIELTERCLTSDGGLKLFFKIKSNDVKDNIIY